MTDWGQFTNQFDYESERIVHGASWLFHFGRLPVGGSVNTTTYSIDVAIMYYAVVVKLKRFHNVYCSVFSS